jgi:hypothetical protein
MKASQYPMVCRFSDKHGTFSNAVVLRKHYDTAHAHEYVPPKPRSAAVAVPAVIAHPKPPKPLERHTAPLRTVLTVDDIVLPAIQGMAYPGNAVPVSALAALFAWRDATARMLHEVSGSG